MYRLIWTANFTRAAKKLTRYQPEWRAKLAAILRDLETDPFQPHLKLHSLHGALNGMQAVSLTYDYRIILTVVVTEKEVMLLDIGSHDEVYR